MLTEKDLKELIKQGKIQTSDVDFEEQDDLQKQKLELQKQKLELEKQKLEIQKQKLTPPQKIEKFFDKTTLFFAIVFIVCIIILWIVYSSIIK